MQLDPVDTTNMISVDDHGWDEQAQYESDKHKDNRRLRKQQALEIVKQEIEGLKKDWQLCVQWLERHGQPGQWCKQFKPLYQLTANQLQDKRKNGSMCKADRPKTKYNCELMMLSTRGLNAGHRKVDKFIIDSGAPLHCTGDRSLFSDNDYTELPPGKCIFGVSGKEMPVHGVGSIRKGRFQLPDVYYVPSLNKPNINKTIISVSKLTELGYSVDFDGTSCTVIDKRNLWAWLRNKIVGKAHMEHGLYMLDYLSAPLDRALVPTSSLQGHGLVKSLWSAALTGWNTITEPRSSQRASAQRPPI